MQWDGSENAGFTTGTPWFAVNPNYTWLNYEAQEKDPDSLLHFYRKLVSVRRRPDLEETFIYGRLIPVYRIEAASSPMKEGTKETVSWS